MALLLPPFARRESGTRLHVPGQGERRPTHLRIPPAPLDPDVDVDAARAGRLRPADEAHGLKRLLGCERDVADLGPPDARHRVEVDPQLVGVVEVLGPDRVGVEVDAAEIGDPGEPGRIVDDDLVRGSPGRECQRRGPEPVGQVLRRTLLEERLLRIPSTNRFSAIGLPPAPRRAPSATAR